MNALPLAIPSNAPRVRGVSKRREKGAVQLTLGETVIDCDRSNPVLGNRHVLRNHHDAQARAEVIAAHKRDLEADVARNGP